MFYDIEAENKKADLSLAVFAKINKTMGRISTNDFKLLCFIWACENNPQDDGLLEDIVGNHLEQEVNMSYVSMKKSVASLRDKKLLIVTKKGGDRVSVRLDKDGLNNFAKKL